MYVVTNLENFVRSSRLLDHHTYGYYTFNALMSLSGLKHWLADYFFIDDTPYLTSGYNTYSFLWVFYRDYGVVGLAVIPFIMGLAIALLYYRMRTRPSLPLISLYAMAVFVMFISFFHNALSLLHFVFNTALVYAVTSAVTRHAPLIEAPSTPGASGPGQGA
jgi:oligosaccharide repeat unit polymerase